MIRLLILITLISINHAPTAEANEKRWYAPESIITQTAGYLGYVSMGAGFSPLSRWKSDIILGYVPEDIGGEQITQLAWKNTIHPVIFNYKGIAIKPLSFGLSVIWGFDDNLIYNTPKRYGDYWEVKTNPRLALNVGIEAKYKKHGGYIELSALDKGVFMYARNFGEFTLSEVTTLAFGYRYFLD